MILEIILSTNDNTYARIAKLYAFLIQKIKEINKIVNKSEITLKFTALIPFIEIFCPSIRLSALGLNQIAKEAFVLECN